MSPSLKSMVNDAHSGRPGPYVAPLHTKWLMLPESQQIYSEAAIKFIEDVLRGRYKRPRDGRFSPSQLGRCHREQLFGFAGVAKLGENPDSSNLMGLGTWGHLRWQAEGLTYPFDDPWLSEAERFVHDKVLRFGGSLDGDIRDGSFFELKTCHYSVLSKVMDTEQPKFEHRMQRGGYRMLTAIDASSLVYEERGSGNYYEFRLEGEDPEAEDAAMAELETLNDHIDAGTLPPMLKDCVNRTGTTYKNCAYRTVCPLLNSMQEATEAREEAV